MIDVNGAKLFKFAKSGCVLDRVTVVNTGTGASYKDASGLFVNATGCAVSNCVFRQCGNNLGSAARWAIYANKKGVTISGCIVTNNWNYYCPGIHVVNGLVENCLIADNRARGTYSAGYRDLALTVKSSDAGATVVRNCTIAGNSYPVDGVASPAVVLNEDFGNGRTVSFENNVVRGNTNGSTEPVANDWSLAQKKNTIAWTGDPDMSRWKNNCVPGAEDANALGGSGNFSDDPLLESDGFSLFPRSPCVGAATADAPATDVFGRVRPSPASLGAVECFPGGSFRVYATASPSHALVPGTIRVRALASGEFAEPLAYAFDLDGDGAPDETNETGEAELSAPGVYAVSVSVADADGRTASAPVFGDLVVHGPVVHVRPDADAPVRPFATEATATDSISDAILDCLPGCTVLVHPGIYRQDAWMYLRKPIAVVGPSAAEGEAVVAGGRLIVSAAGAAVRNLVFDQKPRTSNAGRIDRPPVEMTEEGVVSNCVFRNTTDWNAYPQGQVNASAGLVTGCVVSNCVSHEVAGIVATGTAAVENCLVADCRSGVKTHYQQDKQAYRGAAFNVGGSAVVRNCTAVSNLLVAVVDGTSYDCWASPALYAQPGFAGQVANCVFAGNARRFEADGAYVATNDVAIGAALVSHCAVEDPLCDYAGYEGMVTNGIAFLPGTVVPAPGSSLVDAGLARVAIASSVDLLGRRRRAGRIDIGCAEAEKPRGTILLMK